MRSNPNTGRSYFVKQEDDEMNWERIAEESRKDDRRLALHIIPPPASAVAAIQAMENGSI